MEPVKLHFARFALAVLQWSRGLGDESQSLSCRGLRCKNSRYDGFVHLMVAHRDHPSSLADDLTPLHLIDIPVLDLGSRAEGEV